MKIGYKIDYSFCCFTKKPSLLKSPIQSEFINLEMGIIRVGKFGSGKKTILLNTDPPNGLEHSVELINLLSKKFTVLVYELPCYGYSRPSSHFEYDLNTSKEIILGIINHYKIEKLILACPCINGFVALNFAIHYPERIEAFITTQTTSWEDSLKWLQKLDPLYILRTPILGQIFNWMFDQSIEKIFYNLAEQNKIKREEWKQLQKQRNKNGTIYCLASPAQNMVKIDPFRDINLNISSLIIWGEKDKTHLKSNPKGFQKYLPNAEFVSIESAGHFVELSETKKWTSIVMEKYS